MNKRIKEIAIQSKLGSAEFGNGIQYYVATQETFEKFAELIVRECAQVCRDQSNVYALKADRDNCAIAIEEHFGVEE